MSKYDSQCYWGEMLIKAHRYELHRAEKNLAEYIAWWNRFINYCHTGK